MAPPTISPHTCSAIIKLVFEYSLKTASSTGGEMFQEEPHRQEYASPLWQDHWMVHGLYQTCVKTVNGLGFTSNHNPDILSYDHPGFLPSFNTAPTPVQWGLRRSGYATAIVWEGCWVIYGPCVIGMEYVMSPGLISNHTPDMLSYHPGFWIELENPQLHKVMKKLYKEDDAGLEALPWYMEGVLGNAWAMCDRCRTCHESWLHL